MKKAYYFPVFFFFFNKVNQLSILSFFQISSALTLHELPQDSGAMANRGLRAISQKGRYANTFSGQSGVPL